MAISLLSEEPLEENAALFENDAELGQDEGSITWSQPEETSAGNWEFEFEGFDVEGGTIPSTSQTMQSVELPSPSQVFWWLAEKAKETLCPTCSNGY